MQVTSSSHCDKVLARAQHLLENFGHQITINSDGDWSVAIDQVLVFPIITDIPAVVGTRDWRYIVTSLDIEDREETFTGMDHAIIAAAKRAYAKRLELRLQAIQDKEMGDFYVEQAQWEKDHAQEIKQAIRRQD